MRRVACVALLVAATLVPAGQASARERRVDLPDGFHVAKRTRLLGAVIPDIGTSGGIPNVSGWTAYLWVDTDARTAFNAYAHQAAQLGLLASEEARCGTGEAPYLFQPDGSYDKPSRQPVDALYWTPCIVSSPTPGMSVPWSGFESAAPDLAEVGLHRLYKYGPGLEFLATVRADGGPRVHPVCPTVFEDRLWVLVGDSPKQRACAATRATRCTRSPTTRSTTSSTSRAKRPGRSDRARCRQPSTAPLGRPVDVALSRYVGTAVRHLCSPHGQGRRASA